MAHNSSFRKVSGERPKALPLSSYLPKINFSSDQLPEIKSWDVGKTYEIAIKVRQTSKREEGKSIFADFEVIGVKVLSNKTKRQDFLEYSGSRTKAKNFIEASK